MKQIYTPDNFFDMTNLAYQKEAGVLVSETNKALLYIPGETGHVDFPGQTVWELHKKRPGSVYKFAHTHPTRFKDASATDIAMLTTWAKAFYPFPARLSVITFIGETRGELFQETTYFAKWQDKEIWEQDKSKKREVEVLIEDIHTFTIADETWKRWLVDFSYRKPIDIQ